MKKPRPPHLKIVPSDIPEICPDKERLNDIWVISRKLLRRLEQALNSTLTPQIEKDVISLLTVIKVKYAVLMRENLSSLVKLVAQKNKIEYLEKIINSLEEPELKFLINALLSEKFSPLKQENKVLRSQLTDALVKAAKYETLYKNLLAKFTTN